MITNKQAFTNILKKQLNIHYNISPNDVTYFAVDALSDTIEFAQGNHAIISDYIYSTFGSSNDLTKARTVASNILTHYWFSKKLLYSLKYSSFSSSVEGLKSYVVIKLSVLFTIIWCIFCIA